MKNSVLLLLALYCTACSNGNANGWNKLPYDEGLNSGNCETEMNGLRLETVCPDDK